MKLACMQGPPVPMEELRKHGFEAIQMFFGWPPNGDATDPTPASIRETLAKGNIDLAAMTLHIDLIGPDAKMTAEVARAVRCVARTAQLRDCFKHSPKPVMVWHPSGYPEDGGMADAAVVSKLAAALTDICRAGEEHGVDIAVEMTRAGSVPSAEVFVALKERVRSQALRVCMDAANFTPDRTPLERAVRMVGPDIVIAHGKDVSFRDDGEVAAYGPTGSGKLNYAKYLQALKQYAKPTYFVLEYYANREQMLAARDIVAAGL